MEYKNKKVLKLTVSRAPFEVMVTGEKTDEYRNAQFKNGKSWIESRLFNEGTRYEGARHYDFVEIRNGYGGHMPYFISKYRGFTELAKCPAEDCGISYSNGLVVDESDYDYVIHLGEIVEIGNWPKSD